MAIVTERKGRVIAQLGFNGGLNLRDAGDELSPLEASAIRNMVFTERGAAIARLGCSLKASVGSSGDRVLSNHVFDRGTSAPQYLIHLSDGSLRYSTDLASFTTIATGLSTSSPFCYETFNGKVYMSNGVDDYRSWDGSTQTTFGSIPKFKYLKLWKDTMFGAGAEATKINSSDPADAETWPATNYTHLHKDDGDLITGLGSDGLFLIVFKRGKVFAVYDAATLGNRLMDHEKGCEGHFSVVNHENNVYYLSRRGIVRWLSQSPGEIVSGRLDPLFDPNVINFQYLSKAYAYRLGHKVGWTLPEAGQTVPSFQIEFYPHLPERPFTMHRMPARTFATWRKDSSEILIGGKDSANKVMQYFTGGTDEGTTFTSFIQTGWVDFDWPDNRKYLAFMRVLARGRLNCYIKRDYAEGIIKNKEMDLVSSLDLWDTSDKWDNTQTWGGGASVNWVDFHPDVYGRQFAFRFEGTQPGVSSRRFDVSGKTYLESVGQWGVQEIVLHALQMGDRLP